MLTTLCLRHYRTFHVISDAALDRLSQLNDLLTSQTDLPESGENEAVDYWSPEERSSSDRLPSGLIDLLSRNYPVPDLDQLSENSPDFQPADYTSVDANPVVAKRFPRGRYFRRNCDFTRLSHSQLVEFFRTGRICGRRISALRFGLTG